MCLPIFLIIRMKLKKLLKLSVEKKQHNEAEENVDKYGDMLCVGNANAINVGNIEDAEEDEHDCEVEVGEEENVEADIVDNYAHEVGEEVKVERGEECGVYAVIYEGEDDEDGDGEGLEEEDRIGDERESGVCVVIDDSMMMVGLLPNCTMGFSLTISSPVIRRIIMCLPIFLIIRMKLKKLLKLSVEKKQHNEAEENVDKYGDMLCVGNANAIN
ncbi:hypothetical protein MN116_009080, partial [Schistosoma mekongi]